jgi:hypothetical protein
MILWHIDPFVDDDGEITSNTTAVSREWLSSDHVGYPTESNSTEERYFLRDLY